MVRFVTGGLIAALYLTAIAHAAQLPARASGLWQSKTSVFGPNDRPMAQAQNVVTLTCVDPETDQKFLLVGQSRCSELTVSGSGATYEINGICAQPAGTAKIHETLHYSSSKSLQLKANFSTSSGKISMTSNLQWMGKCPAGMVPGDEGEMVNGSFVKAGNINDHNP
ncbi:DUF3617 family protein [Acidocella sp.]|uniref:DUF3617 domain-containing protein n=1 Tax=Acidocella sp. TaxID=50710 RepID=UPI00260DCBB2|nr:DUF3617 family protein [Acidocella sp.]